MADNVTTTTTVSSVPDGTKLAARTVTYSGDTGVLVAPVGLVTFGGSDDAKTVTDVTTSNPLPVSDAGGSLTVDAASLPLPTGASTAAKQPALGTAGTASTDVITVQGIASGTALKVALADGAGTALTSKAPGSEKALSVAIVDGSGNQVTSFGGSGGTSQTDDAAFTPGSGSITPVGGIYRVTRDAVDDGDAGAVAMTAKRGQYVVIETPLGDSAMDDTNDAVKVAIVADSVGSAVDTEDGSVAIDQANVALVVGLNYHYNGSAWVRQLSPVKVDDAAFTPATDTVTMIGAQADAAAPDSVDEGDAGALRMTLDRALHNSIRDSAGNNRGANVNASNELLVAVSTVPSHAVTNAGTFAVQESGTQVQVDDAAFTPATSKVTMAGFEADEGSTDSVDEGDGGAARMTLDRKQIVTIQPHTVGGLSAFYSLDLDETEEEVKGTPGQLYGWFIANLSTATIYVKFYNDTAANVTVGSTAPLFILPIPGNASDTVAANALGAQGIAFSVAISVAAVTGFADNDTTGAATNKLIATLFYK